MMPSTKGADGQAVAKKLRDGNAALVQKQNDADTLVQLDRTARLRALRLAKEAADQAAGALQPKTKKPIKKATKD